MKILKFSWNNKELFWEIKNHKLQKGKKENENEIYDLNLEEEKILEEVYSKILGFANLLKLKNISFKNKLFAHYLNQNNFNIFYEIKDNKLTIPNEKDLKILNYYYNNQEELWAINSLNSKDNNYFKRVINIGKKALVVYLASTITLGLSGEVVVNASVGDYHPPIEQNIITNEEENENLVLSYEDIVELVNLNPYLSLDEKNLILDQKEYFIAALGYLNNSHVKKMLANLKIEYYPENRGTIQGQYNDSNYTVNIYNATNFAQASKSTITHELSHAFAISPCSYGNLGYGQKTIEALNVIVNNEYFGHGQIYDQSYNCIIPYIRILCEIVDSEILKQAFFKTDIGLLENYLLTITQDEVLVKDLFIAIDTYFNLNDELVQNFIEGEEKQNILNLITINKSIILNSLKQLYETKTNESILNNEEIMYWYNKNDILQTKIQNYFQDKNLIDMAIDNFTNVLENKTYFTNNCPHTILNLCTKIGPKNYPLSNLDIKIYIEDGAISQKDGQYYINENYEDQFITLNNQVYIKGFEALEFDEYQLQNNNIVYQK